MIEPQLNDQNANNCFLYTFVKEIEKNIILKSNLKKIFLTIDE